MGSLEQLNLVQALIEVERSLTTALEKSASLLDRSLLTSKSSIINYDPDASVARPTPKNIEEVERVWAVARNLASRTSAPAGWNPACPPVGFATPNPRPDQLRGGALGSLQLERAQRADRAEQNKKRQRQEEEARKKKEEAERRAKRARDELEKKGDASLDPKSRELSGKGHQIGLDRSNSDIVRSAKEQQRKRPSQQAIVEASMNLSDSSSSSSEDDDDEDESD